MDRERSVHIYIRRYLGGIPIERECFCGHGDISRRCTDSYEWSGIVKEKFHSLSILRSFFYVLFSRAVESDEYFFYRKRANDSGVYPISTSCNFRSKPSSLVYLIFIELSISITKARNKKVTQLKISLFKNNLSLFHLSNISKINLDRECYSFIRKKYEHCYK